MNKLSVGKCLDSKESACRYRGHKRCEFDP